MQITLAQADIEAALKLYVSQMGLTQPVEEITFSQTRKGGHSIAADICLADPTLSTIQPAAIAPVGISTQPVEEVTTTETVEKEETVEQAGASIFG